MKLQSILLCCLPLLVTGEKLDNEKNVKLEGNSDQGLLELSVMIEYNHKVGEEYSYPTSFLSHAVSLAGTKLIDTLKLDKTTMNFEDLRNHITKKLTGKQLVNALITDETFSQPISEYPDYVLENFDVEEQRLKYSIRHFYNHNKLVSAVLPFYFIIGILALLLFANRSKFDNYHQMQFSQTSKVLFSFLIFRLFYDLLYLGYLISFQFFGKFHENSFLYYFFLVSDQIIGLIIFHSAVTIFVQGFLTVSNDKRLWYHKDTILMSFFYFLSFTCIRIYLRVKHLNNVDDSLTKYVFSLNDQTIQLGYFMVFFTFALRLAIFYLVLKSFQKTYQRSSKSWRFLNSFIVIFIAYCLSGYIKFPIFSQIQSLTQTLKNELIGEGDIDSVTEAISIPEIVQIITCCRLIYIWREKSSKKQDEETH